MSVTATMAREVELNNVEPQLVGAFSSAAHDGSGLRNRTHNYDSNNDGDSDDEGAVEQEPPTEDERKWSLALVVVGIVDIIISGIIAIVAFRFAYRDNGISLYCLGIQALSHLTSSLLLALRFIGEHQLSGHFAREPAQGLLRKSRRKHLVREQILTMSMGIVMMISASALLFKAFRKIKFWNQWYKDTQNMDAEAQWATEFLAWYGFSVYVLQAVFRFVAARKLRRSIIWHGFWASVVSLVFLFVLGFAASYQKEWSWKAEPIAAIILSFVALGESIRVIISFLDDVDVRLRFDSRA